MREDIIDEAWQQTLDTFTNANTYSEKQATLRNAVANGTATMQEVLTDFRHAIRDISPKYHVSPDAFARNAA